MADVPRVFLSYSHGSAEHAARVLALADALCDLGIDLILDRRVLGEEAPGQGTGVRWEGTLIYNRIAYGEPAGVPPSGGPWWNVPYPRNPNFTGREAILEQLETALASGTPAASVQAIAGLGGVGKTQTAVEYVYRHRDQYCAVLWVHADPGTNLVSGYRELAEVLDLPEKDARDSNEAVTAVRRKNRRSRKPIAGELG